MRPEDQDRDGRCGRGLGHDRIIAGRIRCGRHFRHVNWCSVRRIRCLEANLTPPVRRPGLPSGHGSRDPSADAETHDRPRDPFRPGRRPEVVLVPVLPGPRPRLANATATDNRELLAARREGADRPGTGRLRDGPVVGWVSLGPRDATSGSTYSKVLAPVDDRSGLVDRLLRRRPDARGAGRRRGAPRRRHRLGPGHGATLSRPTRPICQRRTIAVGERLSGHARDVRAGRIRGRRRRQLELDQPVRPSSGARSEPRASSPPTSSVAGRPSSSVEVDMAQPPTA